MRLLEYNRDDRPIVPQLPWSWTSAPLAGELLLTVRSLSARALIAADAARKAYGRVLSTAKARRAQMQLEKPRD